MNKKTYTSKKVRVAGIQTYINADTGEAVDMHVTRVEERDFDFAKVWMKSFLTTLELVGNQKSRLAYWIIEHLNRDNYLLYTYDQMAEETGISKETVRVTIKILMDADFLRRKSRGVYIVNPDIVFKGTHASRMNLLTQYTAADYKKPMLSDQDRLALLEAQIDHLQKLANDIRTKSTQAS